MSAHVCRETCQLMHETITVYRMQKVDIPIFLFPPTHLTGIIAHAQLCLRLHVTRTQRQIPVTAKEGKITTKQGTTTANPIRTYKAPRIKRAQPGRGVCVGAC